MKTILNLKGCNRRYNLSECISREKCIYTAYLLLRGKNKLVTFFPYSNRLPFKNSKFLYIPELNGKCYL